MNRVVFWLAAVLFVSGAARAAAVCTVSTSGIAFGSFNPLPGQSADTNGTISVTCTGTPGDSTNYTVTVSQGLGSFAQRKMTSGTDILSYNLYRDSSCTQVWGDGSGSTYSIADTMTLSSTSNSRNYVVYSRIASGQNAAKARIYSDNVLVTITY